MNPPPQCPDFILAETTDGLILSYRGEEFTVDDDMRKDLIAYLEIQSRRDKVLDVLDIELDKIKSRIESSTMGQPLSERSRGEIISLLHAREKIKYLRQSKAGSP